MTDAPGRNGSPARLKASPAPTGTRPTPAVRAARKKELAHRLFGHFLEAVERSDEFEWRGFLDGLESVVWREALSLAEGSCREAAAIVGIPYSTFMSRLRLERGGGKDSGQDFSSEA